MTERSIKIKHTEIELPADEERLIEVVVGLLSGGSATPLGVRISRKEIDGSVASEQAVSQPVELEVRQEKRTARRAGGSRRAADEYIHPSRKTIIDAICQPHSSDESFNNFIAKEQGVGKRCLVVLHLARETTDATALTIPEVASILERKFRKTLTLNQVSLAMVRMAAKSESPLIRGSEASWDRTKTEYWPTEAGLEYVKRNTGN